MTSQLSHDGRPIGITPMPSPSILQGSRRAAGTLAMLAAQLTLVAGCENADQMAEAQSVLAPLFQRPTPVDAVTWAADEYDADKRYRGTMLLANAPFGGEDVYLRIYEANLSDKSSPAVRAAALRGLTLHGNPEHVPMIIPFLKDEEPQARTEAARALQRLHNPAAVVPLLEVIRVPETAKANEYREALPDVRALAADALGQYAERRVLDGLVASLADSDLLVVHNALRSLKTLTGENFGENRRDWVLWLKDHNDAFARRSAYVYPVFQRDKVWWEHVPLVPDPPNEAASTPVGADLLVDRGATGGSRP